MDEIGKVNGTQASMPVDRMFRTGFREVRRADSAEPGDRVEISRMADLLGRMQELPDVRTSLVARIRAEIEAGTYTTDDKIDVTVDRLLADLDA
jgi:anti-sigma28 factor (negative regulator of flagellin synthesis)